MEIRKKGLEKEKISTASVPLCVDTEASDFAFKVSEIPIALDR